MIELGRTGSLSHAHAAHQDGKLHVRTVFEDDAALAKNRRIRDSGMLNKGQLGIHDDADMRAVISCPSVEQWRLFQRDHADIYKSLTTRGQSTQDDADRMKGARQLQLLHPAWVVYTRL